MKYLPLISWDSDPLRERELAKVELSVGELPADYREFLLVSNGGRPIADEVRIGDTEFCVTGVSVIDPDFPPEVVTAEVFGQPSRFIKIAEEHYCPILMEVDGPNAGNICYWNFDEEDEYDATEAGQEYLPDEDTLELVAESFSDFMSTLVAIYDELPDYESLERNVVNCSKYGDHFFDEAKATFDSLSLEELNTAWPKDGEYANQPIYYAALWSQTRTAEYLIDRGVDIHTAVTCCTNSFEISRMMINAGATDEELRRLLRSASSGLAATSATEDHYRIIMYLLENGTRPDFTNADETAAWASAMNGIYAKKILSFLLSVIDFPDTILDQIHKRLSTRL